MGDQTQRERRKKKLVYTFDSKLVLKKDWKSCR
jgi:hypothetical protein